MAKPTLTLEEGKAIIAGYPKDAHGNVDLEKLTVEQEVIYWQIRSKEQTAGFNKFKEEKDTEIETLKNKKAPENKATLTEEELAAKIPGYDKLSASEKQLLKDAVVPLAGNADALAKQVKILLDAQNFEEEFSGLVEEEAYKCLTPHKKAFKVFAYKAENLSTPTRILADSYILTNKLNEAPKGKRNGLEGGNGGSRQEPVKEGEYTAEDVERIRKNDPKLYAKLARTGKLRAK